MKWRELELMPSIVLFLILTLLRIKISIIIGELWWSRGGARVIKVSAVFILFMFLFIVVYILFRRFVYAISGITLCFEIDIFPH